ncbi:DUF4230 domain-containing protein [Maribellus mangrovi]|uniref:DUF4230 domain-containing protein n=1 Tax=Maribellus mangrovi TaxID=3133146 RepID=UPI0030EB94ED
MEILVLLGIILGLALGIVGSSFYFKSKQDRELNQQSALLLEKIKQVCKLITVEGEFSEIFTHRDEKNMFFKLIQFEKKALLIVKAKVMIGFDFTKIKIEVNTQKKQILLSRFPAPEILSIDNDLEYYDVQKGIINKFSGTDLTSMNKKSKDFIREKVADSDLYILAGNQAAESIQIIRALIESVGWVLVSENLAFKETEEPKKIS